MNIDGTKVLFETISRTEKELQECPITNLTRNNEWNPTSVLLGLNVSINWIQTEPVFKEKMITLLPRKISKTTRFDDDLEDLPTRKTYYSTERHKHISAEVLADRLGIGIEISNATLKETLHRGTRLAILPTNRI